MMMTLRSDQGTCLSATGSYPRNQQLTLPRAQWRAQRQQNRQREDQEDVDDRRLESEELKSLEAESEDFLQKQMAELASLEEKQRQAGLLADDAAPVKLAIAAQAVAEPKETKPTATQLNPRPTIALGDEDDDANAQRKRRALVKLDYEKGLDEAEEVAKTRARLLDISKNLPRSVGSIFDSVIEWSAVQAVSFSPPVSVAANNVCSLP